jgi:CheY-like chemotaxis protein
MATSNTINFETALRSQMHESAIVHKAGPPPAQNGLQNVLLTVAVVLSGIMVLRKLGQRIATQFDRRFKPSRITSSGAVSALAEVEISPEVAAALRAGPFAPNGEGTPGEGFGGSSSGHEMGVGDSAAQAAQLQEALASVAKDLVIARNFLSEASRATGDSSRRGILTALASQIGSLKRKSELPQLLPIWQMASALEGLLGQLARKSESLTASTLRTATGAVEVLETLCVPGLRPDLAGNPPLRLLAVDDDAITRTAISAALKKLLNQPELAADGAAALVLVEKESYDVIFVDVEMPGMDGFELCTKIHQTGPNANTPVVFVTCHSDFEARAKSTKAGGHDLIAKPFLAFEIAVKALTLVLRARLGEAGGGRLPASGEAPSKPATRTGHGASDARMIAHLPAPSRVTGKSSATNRATDKPHTEFTPEFLKPSPDEFARAFMENAPADLQALREQVVALAQPTDEKMRNEAIEELYLGFKALAAEAGRAQLQTASRLGSALQGMFKKFLEQPKRLLPSAIGVATAALDVLNDLCAGGHNPDLANPPVRVLVVDDDPIACRAISATLQLVFERPVSVGSGEMAVALAAEKPFDLIFLDVLMPGMDGFTACPKIHETSHNRETPVVFVTSNGDVGSRARATEAGGAGFIEKSALSAEITVTALTFCMRSRLQKREAAPVLEEAVC